MRAVLFGGPLDRREMDDVPEETETMSIPANISPKHAEYRRAGDGIDARGRFARFDFWAVYSDRPLPGIAET
jgi:hypothetical protein